MWIPMVDFSSEAATLLSGWIAFFGAVIGGALTLVGVWLTLKHYTKTREQEKNDLVIGLCQIIHTEITNLREIDKKGLGELLSMLKPGEPLLGCMPIEQDYMVAYKANANLIGQIPDRELRLAIVSTYVDIAGIIDSINLNNKMFLHIEQLEIENIIEKNEKKEEVIAKLKIRLGKYADKLKDTHSRVGEKTGNLLKLLENHLEKQMSK